MASMMRNIGKEAVDDGLYRWGVAELSDKWVILHRNGLPKWAIYYKGKGQTVVVPCHMLKSQRKGLKVKRRVKRKSDT